MALSYAAERARTQISGLLSLDQRFVWRVEHGVESKVPVEQVRAGDTIAAHAGEKIVVDGRVLAGSAAVNQASITGESNPAMKHEGTLVYAGSVVEAGELVIRVEKVGKDTSLAHIVHLVEEAQSRKAPVQNFADQMANFLVPVSFLGAAIVYGATRDWQRVLNLLFIDFSCGLKLSTATAISAAISAAAKRGILVKGGNYIEALAETDTVVLDKTGTLTVGIPQIAFMRTAPGVEEKEMLLLAASAEQHSVHPLAVAIQKYVKEKGWTVPQHEDSQTVVARGMLATVPAMPLSKSWRTCCWKISDVLGCSAWAAAIFWCAARECRKISSIGVLAYCSAFSRHTRFPRRYELHGRQTRKMGSSSSRCRQCQLPRAAYLPQLIIATATCGTEPQDTDDA